MTYHLDWTVFLFAHTISEVLDLLAFILVFVAAAQQLAGRIERSQRMTVGGSVGPGRSVGRVGAVIPFAVLALASVGCVGGGPDGAEASPVATTTVDMPKSYRFAPQAITVEAGSTVTWTNSDNFTHSVRSRARSRSLQRPGRPRSARSTPPERPRRPPLPPLCQDGRHRWSPPLAPPPPLRLPPEPAPCSRPVPPAPGCRGGFRAAPHYSLKRSSFQGSASLL